MPKLFNCETCGFSTKYKNRIDYHINKRRTCGVEIIKYKRDENDKDEKIPSDDETDDVLLADVLDDLKLKQNELNELKLLLETKEQTLTQRENEIKIRELKLSEYLQKLANEKKSLNANPVINPNNNNISNHKPQRYKFI